LTYIATVLDNSIYARKISLKLKKAQINYLADPNSMTNIIFNLDLNEQFIFLNNYWEKFSDFKISEG
jgi:hypothetical protein